jgi:uncharacterized RDD family membrane protein YckC
MAQPPSPQPPSPLPPSPQAPYQQQSGQPVLAPYSDGPAPGVKFAGAAGRLVAYLIDGFVAGVVVFVVFMVLTVIAAASSSAGADTLAGLTWLVMAIATFGIMLLYFPYFWQRSGQTPGMKVMRIRVVRDADGGPVTWGPAIIRLIGYWVSSAVFYIGFIWILVDKRKRGWHDLMAGTCVVEV